MEATCGYARNVPIPRFIPQLGGTPPLECRRAGPDDRPAAVAFALGTTVRGVPDVERRARAEGLDLGHAWAGWRGRGFVGSAIVIPHPGRTSLLVAGRPRDEPHADDLGLIIRHALADREALPGTHVVQALLEPGDAESAHALRAGGLLKLATLEYQERGPGTPIERVEPPGGCEVLPWSDHDRSDLAELLARTSVDSLDCPGLSAMRDPADVAEGHLATCANDTSGWHVARMQGRIAGVALVAVHAQPRTVDLVYLGLVPEARGIGLGRALLHGALRDAAMRRQAPVSLAVDVRNTPALRAYARAGFVPVRRRDAWIASVRA
jgi:ribosomal protein S18 acetylase RimI-like enzyme